MIALGPFSPGFLHPVPLLQRNGVRPVTDEEPVAAEDHVERDEEVEEGARGRRQEEQPVQIACGKGRI